MCHQDTRCVQEAIAAEESLSIYCKPVELYNILQRRALRSPSFLQRCLHYKIEAKRKRRLRNGNVIFNYQYYNNSLQKTEATVDFCCPFCLVRCASYKGLRSHLSSSHDLFNFEFWVTEEFQAVNVSVKTDIWGSEIVADEVDPRLQTFFFCSKPHKRRRLNNQVQNANHVHLYDSPEASWRGSSADCLEKDSCICLPITTSQIDDVPAEDFILQNCETDGGPNKEADKIPFSANHLQSAGRKFESTGPENVLASECTDATGVRTVADLGYDASESAQQVSASNTLSAMLQGAKTRKLSVERTDPKNVVLLQKRQFYHSHRAQPMELEQVLSDRDSEDEVDDDDITDFEDRRMLDDFVDVTKDEKHLMHLWNSFVRKQRVLADGHIPWACEAFLTLHGRDLIRAPTLIWCWRLFMIKLWNHGLLDGRTMNNCNIILERYRSESADPEKS